MGVPDLRQWRGALRRREIWVGRYLLERSAGDEPIFTSICEAFGKNIQEHIAVYGADNDQRLTGLHETHSSDKFSYGESIRIPIGTIEDG